MKCTHRTTDSPACTCLYSVTSCMYIKHDLGHRHMHVISLLSTFCSWLRPCVLGPSCIETHCLCVRTAGCKVIWTHARTHKHMWASTHRYAHSFPYKQSWNSLYCQRIIECISCREGGGRGGVHSVPAIRVGPLLKLDSNHLNNNISMLAPRTGAHRRILPYERVLGVCVLSLSWHWTVLDCFVASFAVVKKRMQTLHPVTVSSPPPLPLCLPSPVPNQFPSLLLCPGFPAAARVWNTVGTLFGQLDHCFWLVWDCCLFSPNLIPGNVFYKSTYICLRISLNVCSVCVCGHEYNSDMCCVSLTVC